MKAPSIFGPSADTLPCCDYSLAYLLNRWLVPGTPVPDAQTGGTIFMTSNPYYEVMVPGNPWLPEDLLYSIAQFSEGSTGIYGTAGSASMGSGHSCGPMAATRVLVRC